MGRLRVVFDLARFLAARRFRFVFDRVLAEVSMCFGFNALLSARVSASARVRLSRDLRRWPYRKREKTRRKS